MPIETPSSDLGPARPLLFLHLPKAAGTTLKSVLERVYEGRRVAFLKVQEGDLEAFAARPALERAGYDVVAGHFAWAEREILPEAKIITMLRDPTERVMSWFYYNKSNTNAEWYKELNHRGVSFEQAVRSRMFPGAYNQMTDMLRDPDARDLRGAVDSARRHLSSCTAFGLAERFGESVEYFAAVLGWPSVEWEDRNVTAGRPRAGDLDAGVRALLRRECAADYALYDFARRLFDKRVGG